MFHTGSSVPNPVGHHKQVLHLDMAMAYGKVDLDLNSHQKSKSHKLQHALDFPEVGPNSIDRSSTPSAVWKTFELCIFHNPRPPNEMNTHTHVRQR